MLLFLIRPSAVTARIGRAHFKAGSGCSSPSYSAAMQLGSWLAIVLAPFVGSFLGVVIERLPSGRAIVFGRSACDHCGETLTARDLIPLVSYLARRGRCSCGRTTLSWFHPGIELASLGVALSAATVLSGWLLWASLGLGWTLLTLAAMDWREFVLPDIITLPLIPGGLVVTWAIDPGLLIGHALGALAGFASFAVVASIYHHARGREGLGLGDAKLLAAAGAWLGWQALPSVVLIAAACGLALALATALAGAKLAWTSRIAFGPHLALAFWLVWLCGPVVIG
jgi:leader peptidase (prepilin peptidase)/N-methyltransferase